MSGGSKQQTSSNTQNYDQRQVNTWTSNAYDLSNKSTNTTNADFSNRSTTNNTTSTTTNADFSNRSTTNNTTDTTTNLWSDSSNRSTTTTNADFSNRSTTNNTTDTTTNLWSDSSNRSTTTTNADFSNRSSSWADNSNRSTTTVYNSTTDGGAVAGALALGGAAVQQVGSQLAGVLGFASKVVDGQNASVAQGYDYADHVFNHALDTVHDSESAAMDAFARASQVQSSTINQLQSAYADAKGTSAAQQKIIFVVLAVAGLAVMARR